MPSILLDHHVTEAAMRPSTIPSRHRWSRRQPRASVASVVAAAPVTHRPTIAAQLLHRDEFPNVRSRFEAEHPPIERFRPVPGGRRAPAVLAELRGETPADTFIEQTAHVVASAALDLDALVITTTVELYAEAADEVVLMLHELVALAEELTALAPMAATLAEVAAL